MAGESPDTSDQQKSSGETTGDARDPRLAVFREAESSPDAAEADGGAARDAGQDAADADAEASAQAPDEPSAPASPDRATAVFRTVGAGRTGSETGEAKAAEASETPESAEAAKSSGPSAAGSAAAPAAGSEAEAQAEPEAGGAQGTDADRDAADVRDGEAAVSGDEDGRPAAGRLPVRPGARGGGAAVGNAPATGAEGRTPRESESSAGEERAEGGAKGATAGRDERLRDAVAAWVSGTSGDESEDAGGADAASASPSGGDDAEKTTGSTAGKKTPSTDAATGAEPDSASGESKAPGADTRTMTFGTLRQQSAERPADQATAVFGALRPGSPEADGAEDGEDAPARRSADRATAFFGAIRPRTPEADRTEDSATAAAPAGAGSETKAADPKAASAGDSGPGADGLGERSEAAGATAVRTKEKEADAEKPGAASGGGGRSERPVDQATAVFGAVRLPKTPEWADNADNAGDADDAGKAGESGKAGEAEEAGKADKGSESGKSGKGRDAGTSAQARTGGSAAPARPGTVPTAPNGRPSTFVPLRSDDAPAAPAAGPSGSSAPAARTTPAKPGAPAAPAASPAPATAAPRPLPESERTKQQPLPPPGEPAPLDLLAQLTNTPPPPETTKRTIVRRVKIWTPLVALLAIVFCTAQALRPLPEPELRLAEQTAFTFEGGKFAMPWPDQGQAAVLVEGVGSMGTYGAQKPVPIASVTKVMTAYVVLKNHPLKPDEPGEKIEIDAQAAQESHAKDESKATVKEGQQFTQRQMLEMMMIPSSNNVARRLARWDAGSEEAFVKKMNAAAKALGMTNTTYTDPSGLKATSKSTATDQLKLARAVMKNETFRKIVATPDIEIPGVGRIFNNNHLLAKPGLGVRGIKTGSSTPAGGALMWATYRTVGGKDRLILGVTLDQHANSTDSNAHLALVLQKAEEQIRAVRGALTSATLVKKGQVVGEVDDGLGGTTPVVATKDLKGAGWPGHNVDFALAADAKGVPHSAKAGTVVGTLTVGTGPGRATVPVALQQDLAEPSFSAKLTRVS